MVRPRVGFLGVGWIGRHRMEGMIATGAIEAAAICDPSPEGIEAAKALAPDAAVVGSFEAMLDLGLDGIVIATPSALHADQTIRALARGAAVFCQKPLGRDAREVARAVAAARRADRRLGVDFSYRFTTGARQVRDLVREGALGRVFAADLLFHNAYGPDKPWFHDRALSGGGCMMDLGVHLVDLALWTLDFPTIAQVDSRLFRHGRPLDPVGGEVEDYAVATLTLDGGAVVRLACSWNLPAGADAAIGATFYGTGGGAAWRNVGGSFYDFVAERLDGTRSERLSEPPESWGARAAADWARHLADDPAFDPEAERFEAVAAVLDRIYA